ncbi:MAG TPA: hypothetical protein VFS40_13205 [Gemmatimonadales bacterium]|nr:hypothetical protein [Gemmatimonadales bacterium]
MSSAPRTGPPRAAAGRRYLAGLALIGGAAGVAGALLPGPQAAGLRLALLVALAVQAPLGWWLVRSVGTPRFLAAWMAGMGARLGLVGLTAFVLVPQTGRPAAPTLVSLVALLFAFLALESIVVMLEHSQAEGR